MPSRVLKCDQCAGFDNERREGNTMRPELLIHTPEGDEESSSLDGNEASI